LATATPRSGLPDLQRFPIYSKRLYKSRLANALNFRKLLQLRAVVVALQIQTALVG
jgi:hypothetical protein